MSLVSGFLFVARMRPEVNFAIFLSWKKIPMCRQYSVEWTPQCHGSTVNFGAFLKELLVAEPKVTPFWAFSNQIPLVFELREAQ